MNDSYVYDAFISYVTADQAWVRRELLPRLGTAGLSYTLSTLEKGSSPARLEAAEMAIQQSRRLVAVLSLEYLADGMAKFENMLAQTLDFQEMTMRVVPLIATPFDRQRLPNRLAMLAAADLTDPEKRERRFAELVAVLKTPLERMDD